MTARRASSGGCITRGWGHSLEVSEHVIDLMSDEPFLMGTFERLYEKHGRRLPEFLGWGETLVTDVSLGGGRFGKLMTSCTRTRGLHTTCWYSSGPSRRPSRRPR